MKFEFIEMYWCSAARVHVYKRFVKLHIQQQYAKQVCKLGICAIESTWNVSLNLLKQLFSCAMYGNLFSI